jgi:hypothetical protein
MRESSPLHRSEQVWISSQARAHFFRQTNGSAQTAQTFCGKSRLSRIFPKTDPVFPIAWK